ncbi:hypothetical protein J3R30DRAFT_3700852 [Lentinula aciculospora]|uniref:Uncharacterized protein n=1 Tax=Lentinula aciculospora TaxID=153920 RepID=A0A9W9AG06_9AGAR|nr:hypothetical protein J3R30DRAFT_3700852 [Lentinula aciculospora]
MSRQLCFAAALGINGPLDPEKQVSNGSRTSDVLTPRSTDVPQPPPTHDHARDALRLALGSILAPKRSTPNAANSRPSSSSGTASPAHFPFPYNTGSHTPSPANSNTPAPQGHLPFPHPHTHQHLHHPHGHSHLIPGREHSHTVSGHSSSSHSPHSSSPATPITETASSPFNHFPRPGLLARSISSSSTQSLPSNRPSPAVGSAGDVSSSLSPDHQDSSGPGLDGILAPAPRLPDASTNTAALPPSVPEVEVTAPDGNPIAKNKFIQTLEGKTPSAWDALIHGSFS